MPDRYGFSKEELSALRRLSTPVKIQDFLDSLPYNPESEGDTCYSPRKVLELRTANCIEGAIFAAAALRVGCRFEPLLMDLAGNRKDEDHVVAIYRIDRCWGSIAKSKFTGLRFREAVYRTTRELAMSYFENYFTEDGEKSLRACSTRPVNLRIFDKKGWMTSEEHAWYIPKHLEKIAHTKLVTLSQIRRLRRVPELELRASMLGYPKEILEKKGKVPP
jgi:hypothetical protein